MTRRKTSVKLVEVSIPSICAPRSAESFLMESFLPGFPEAQVKIDLNFLRHVQTANIFTERDWMQCGLCMSDNENLEDYEEAFEDAMATNLNGNHLLAMVAYFGKRRLGLEIKEKDAPYREGEEVERNILLGRAKIDSVYCWMFITHAWKNIGGYHIQKQIDLHAKPMDIHKWDKKNNPSIAVLFCSFRRLA